MNASIQQYGNVKPDQLHDYTTPANNARATEDAPQTDASSNRRKIDSDPVAASDSLKIPSGALSSAPASQDGIALTPASSSSSVVCNSNGAPKIEDPQFDTEGLAQILMLLQNKVQKNQLKTSEEFIAALQLVTKDQQQQMLDKIHSWVDKCADVRKKQAKQKKIGWLMKGLTIVGVGLTVAILCSTGIGAGAGLALGALTLALSAKTLVSTGRDMGLYKMSDKTLAKIDVGYWVGQGVAKALTTFTDTGKEKAEKVAGVVQIVTTVAMALATIAIAWLNPGSAAEGAKTLGQVGLKLAQSGTAIASGATSVAQGLNTLSIADDQYAASKIQSEQATLRARIMKMQQFTEQEIDDLKKLLEELQDIAPTAMKLITASIDNNIATVRRMAPQTA